MNDTSMTKKTDPKYDDDLVNKRYVDNKIKNISFPSINILELINIMHPIGEIYTTTDSTFNPNIAWGGTWTQLTSDAYFKIVTNNAGNLAGTSSEHKIPLASIPQHRHLVSSYNNTYGEGAQPKWQSIASLNSVEHDYTYDNYTDYQGEGQAYYPYYYGVYAWRRTE